MSISLLPIPAAQAQSRMYLVTPSSLHLFSCLTVAAELDSFYFEWTQEIATKSTAESPPCPPSDEVESMPAPLETSFPPLSDDNTLPLPKTAAITLPLGTEPPFPNSFPFGQPAADKLSLYQLTCICLLARQKCRNTADYHHLITITPVPGEDDLSSVSFDGTLLRGVRLRRVQCQPPVRPNRKMCSFACRSTCWLSNKDAVIRHQKPRRTPTSNSCPSLPPLLICRSREEFCCKRDLVALGGLEICYRENQNHCYDPAKTQLLTIGQSFLDFALRDLRMEDDELMRTWGEIEAGR